MSYMTKHKNTYFSYWNNSHSLVNDKKNNSAITVEHHFTIKEVTETLFRLKLLCTIFVPDLMGALCNAPALHSQRGSVQRAAGDLN